MNTAYAKDIGKHFFGVPALAHGSATAGGAGDGTAANGIKIDLLLLPQHYNSGKFQVAVEAVLAEDATCVCTLKAQDSGDDGSNWTDYVYGAGGDRATATLTLTGGAGGSTERGVIELDVDLTIARQDIRCVFTPQLSAANTDTAKFAGIFNGGGGPGLPASTSV